MTFIVFEKYNPSQISLAPIHSKFLFGSNRLTSMAPYNGILLICLFPPPNTVIKPDFFQNLVAGELKFQNHYPSFKFLVEKEVLAKLKKTNMKRSDLFTGGQRWLGLADVHEYLTIFRISYLKLRSKSQAFKV